MSDYAMYIPYVNRPDLMDKAVNSAWDLRSNLNIIDNSKDGIQRSYPGCFIMRPPVPLTFSQTMNWMLADAWRHGASICIWMHSDAEAEPGTCAKLLELARQYTSERRRWGVLWTNYDALSAINIRAAEDIGEWDTNIAWYTADNDWYYRLKLRQWECIDTCLPVKHTPSQTLNADPEIRASVDAMVPLRTLYYRAKWGNDPGREVFRTPFNR